MEIFDIYEGRKETNIGTVRVLSQLKVRGLKRVLSQREDRRRTKKGN